MPPLPQPMPVGLLSAPVFIRLRLRLRLRLRQPLPTQRPPITTISTLHTSPPHACVPCVPKERQQPIHD